MQSSTFVRLGVNGETDCLDSDGRAAVGFVPGELLRNKKAPSHVNVPQLGRT
jgi:hypothetical protein